MVLFSRAGVVVLVKKGMTSAERRERDGGRSECLLGLVVAMKRIEGPIVRTRKRRPFGCVA
jgi:hypothetical protein